MQIYVRSRDGLSQAEIGRQLGRSKATVSRELRRNASPAGYLPDTAQRRYQVRRQRCRRRLRLADRHLCREVVLHLTQGWSPEQIAGRLGLEYGATVISHETIYRFVYQSPLGRQERLYQYLRRGRQRRRLRLGRRVRTNPIARREFIDARPPAANQRAEIGHWESDSLLFHQGQVANVLVDRRSRFTLLTRLPGRAAADTRRIMVWRLGSLTCRSITADNGSENADHLLISSALQAPFFFCRPYHAWEKGSVENANSLIRRYLPRDTDLDRLQPGDLDAIAADLNHRPRKCLNFLTPSEVFFDTPVALRNRI
jgi:IS30 family transposase